MCIRDRGTLLEVVVHHVEGSDWVNQDEEDDGEGEVDDILEEVVVEEVFELGLYFL